MTQYTTKSTVENPFDNVPLLSSNVALVLFCLTLDIISIADNIIFGVGEIADVFYAPIQAGFVAGMVGKEKYGMFMVGYAFCEEMIPIPLLDILPICTISLIYREWFA